ncbi:protein NOI4-like [Vigna umbellata]|uniref:RIN4 pathogenic type III effector avirulence factor Avr cleavage site domain-containing protein n=2 Tax=Phaseolus angularis TaxID=3914 RepID=A0A0L9UAJ9_PHAAN|nr:protein NOI4 [Vigna angularis]XP_047181120.1 protein NOI4-like [Vigna umbellata]KOM39736.1 hypothetical protein LR48_Vigan03g311800 [Vigna angularis]BAT86574.1 hypothetical protein VIGAN_04424200 [Vigna angularis var. angularis]
MASYYDQKQGKPLPKFGDWDVNDPASAEGFTVIFNKARDEKKIASVSGRFPSQRKYDSRKRKNQKKSKSASNTKKKWFCFGP